MQNLVTPQERSNHVDALLVLRGLACLMVVVAHSSPPVHSIIYRGYDLTWILHSNGFVAVWIFFCLSGYLMGKAFFAQRYSPDIQGVANFWQNRCLRILPLYFVALSLQAILVYPQVLKMENWGILAKAFTFTYVGTTHAQGVVRTFQDFNHPIWSISTEMQFYLIVPFIFFLLKGRLNNQRQIFGTGLSIVILTFLVRFTVWLIFRQQITGDKAYWGVYLYAPLVMNLDIFLTGFLVNPLIQSYNSKQLCSRIGSFKPNQRLIAIIAIVLLHFFSAHHIYTQELGSGTRTAMLLFIWQPLTAFVIAFFIFAFESFDDLYYKLPKQISFETILENPLRILECFGVLSYGIYMWHTPVITSVNSIFSLKIPNETFYQKLATTLILSTFLATLTYYFVERSTERWKVYRSLK